MRIDKIKVFVTYKYNRRSVTWGHGRLVCSIQQRVDVLRRPNATRQVLKRPPVRVKPSHIDDYCYRKRYFSPPSRPVAAADSL